jgi:hypothetical protein
MTYGLHPYGGASYGGAKGAPTSGGGVVIVDPSNPGGTGYQWITGVGPGPYGGMAYAGGGVVDRPAAGGLSITPDEGMGVIRMIAWWTGAPFLRITRRLPDGTTTPVRGAYPIVVTSPTRWNRATDPSFERGVTDWLPGSNTTITPTQGATLAGAWFGRLKAAAAGTVTALVPAILRTDGPFGISFGLRLSAAPTGALTITATWQDSDGTALPASVATIPTGSLTPYVGRWDRIPVQTLTPPPGAVQGALQIALGGVTTTADTDVDALLVEDGADTSGVYFDGSSTYAQWSGTAHRSVSALAVLTEITDREAPLDVPVVYELTAPDQPAFRIVSQPVTLASRGRSWLSHPYQDVAPFRVEPEAAPEESHDIERDLYYIIGSSTPVAVSLGARRAHTATLVVPVENFGERDRLKALLADGAPLLLRAPAEFGRGPGEWLSIGNVGINPPGHGAWDGTRRFTLPYAVCTPPAAGDIGAAA